MKKNWNKYKHHLITFCMWFIIITFLITSCKCGDDDEPIRKIENPTIKYSKKIPVVSFGFANMRDVFIHTPTNTVLVKERGINYLVNFTCSTPIVINLTKDSLDVLTLKTQHYKDSIQIEVFKKYLTK